eukprot:TRINITY_DN58458_c0_g1_i1.p1 TRINITY_DN58458_c0_g1~~TRINITY_DN58458_c0_g1_i1.p1  ORF type:complete len:164 (-),score=32.08 TRINITY_DN58458_c0_g1_i1:172-663(-)
MDAVQYYGQPAAKRLSRPTGTDEAPSGQQNGYWTTDSDQHSRQRSLEISEKLQLLFDEHEKLEQRHEEQNKIIGHLQRELEASRRSRAEVQSQLTEAQAETSRLARDNKGLKEMMMGLITELQRTSETVNRLRAQVDAPQASLRTGPPAAASDSIGLSRGGIR